jgi:mannose-6-phosphate isomerase-like protein (cupin superfamily)
MSTTRRVEKPWGYELIWAHTDRYVGKLLHIAQGHKLSLQYHNKKDETIHVQSGRLLFVVDEGNGLVERELKPGESYHVKPLTKHRMVALTDCDVLEVSTPSWTTSSGSRIRTGAPGRPPHSHFPAVAGSPPLVQRSTWPSPSRSSPIRSMTPFSQYSQ